MPDRLIFAIVYAESMFGLVGYIVHKQGLSREIWNFYADLWIVSINLISLVFTNTIETIIICLQT